MVCCDACVFVDDCLTLSIRTVTWTIASLIMIKEKLNAPISSPILQHASDVLVIPTSWHNWSKILRPLMLLVAYNTSRCWYNPPLFWR